jgi:streptogramin lyase
MRGEIIALLLAAVVVVSLIAVMPATAIVSSRTYTLDADFDEGTLVGVEHETVHDQLQLNQTATTLPFIWVPNSNEGTVSKVDTVTGKELGRYRTGPTSNGNPSRTTVDLQGSCWVGNRDTGTVVKIGLSEAGLYNDTNGDGFMNTSMDLNGDGNVTGAEILPWGQDECVLFEVLLGNSGSGPRGLAIDAANNLWAGTYTLSGGNNFYHIGGDNGTIFDTIDIHPRRSYGALIDGNGNIWSSCLKSYVLKIDPTTKSITKVDLTHISYGLGIDQNNHLFVAGWKTDRVSKIDVNAHTVTHAPQGDANSRGVAVTSDGDVWVVNSNDGDVTRLNNTLAWKATIDIMQFW